MGTIDLSQYCREVEDHLTRVNGGHLVRIVGAGFEVVRQWADAGIPLSVVFRGIELKADRHRLGHARRPLRIEFCEADVREIYESWRRAVGLPYMEPAGVDAPEQDSGRRPPSLTRHLDRAIDRLSRVVGRIDLAESFLQALGARLQELTELRDEAKGARGPAREALTARLRSIDERLLEASRAAAGVDVIASLSNDAARDLAAFRDRLSGDAWRQAINVTVDRLLRDRYGLPTL